MKRICCLVVCLCLLTACTAPTVRDTDLPKGPTTDYENTLPTVKPDPPTADYAEAVVLAAEYPTGQLLDPLEQWLPTDFVYRTSSAVLTAAEGNAVYSPASLYFALSMLAEGVSGDTAAELDALLGDRERDWLLYDKLYRNSEYAQLKIANSLWMSKNYTFRSDFVNTVKTEHRASLLSVDFGKTADAMMTQWVSDNTGGLLRPAFETDELSVMRLINTIYFKAMWADAFRTADDIAFHLPNGETVTTAAMCDTQSFATIYQTATATRVDLDLLEIGKMTLVLPNEGVSLDTLTASPEALEEALTGGTETKVKLILTLPKIDCEAETDLRAILTSLGCEHLFLPENPDLNGFVEENTPLSVGVLRQGARIIWDEEGVSGAAFTDVAVDGTAAPDRLPECELTFDRPFLYGLFVGYEDLAFVGTVKDPN